LFFLQRSDIVGFIVLFISLSVLAFLDTMIVLFQFLLQKNTKQGTKNQGTSIMIGVRYLMALFFPNVTVKRALYDLKIRDNSYCITTINSYLDCNYS
jgi:hypothetical protein